MPAKTTISLGDELQQLKEIILHIEISWLPTILITSFAGQRLSQLFKRL
jgi:hypothetical protein